MILVTTQYLDSTNALYNGGSAIHFYNLNEAKLFAENESRQYPGTHDSTQALCKVYNDGRIIQVWLNGTDITG